MTTYSFLSVQATLAGPGGAAILGSSAGASEEGITVSMKEEKNAQTVGASGEVMNSLRASNAGRITVRLLKTAPANAVLSTLYNFQKSAPSLWGQNTFLVTDVDRGDVVTAYSVAFTKLPDVVYSKDGAMNEWAFDAIVDMQLGAGIPDVNV